jgi:hypothetical protein
MGHPPYKSKSNSSSDGICGQPPQQLDPGFGTKHELLVSLTPSAKHYPQGRAEWLYRKGACRSDYRVALRMKETQEQHAR